MAAQPLTAPAFIAHIFNRYRIGSVTGSPGNTVQARFHPDGRPGNADASHESTIGISDTGSSRGNSGKRLLAVVTDALMADDFEFLAKRFCAPRIDVMIAHIGIPCSKGAANGARARAQNT
jgi:hypothetical protein